MKTIGLIGGMSFESTVSYYQIINETINEQIGGLHSAKILLYSFDFAEIEEHQAQGLWDKSAKALTDVAVTLEKAGADFIVICTNTMHKVAPEMQEKLNIPIIHIAEATADELVIQNIKTVALLGTKYTMTQDFYKSKLINRGINVLIPNEQDIEIVHNVIYDELCQGVIKDSSRKEYQRIIDSLRDLGAQGVILGCTEIGLLISQENSSIKTFDTTIIHAKKAAMTSIE